MFKDPLNVAFFQALYEEMRPRLPTKKPGRPAGSKAPTEFIDKVLENPGLSSRDLAKQIIDPRFHSQEALRKRIERLRVELAADDADDAAKSEARNQGTIEVLMNRTGLPEVVVSFLIDGDGYLIPPREALVRIQGWIAAFEAELGQKS